VARRSAEDANAAAPAGPQASGKRENQYTCGQTIHIVCLTHVFEAEGV